MLSGALLVHSEEALAADQLDLLQSDQHAALPGSATQYPCKSNAHRWRNKKLNKIYRQGHATYSVNKENSTAFNIIYLKTRQFTNCSHAFPRSSPFRPIQSHTPSEILFCTAAARGQKKAEKSSLLIL